MEENKNTVIGIDSINKVTTGTFSTPIGRNSVYYKLVDSFRALAKEYRISERWREHFNLLFDEIPPHKEDFIFAINARIDELEKTIEIQTRPGMGIGYPAGTNPTNERKKELESLLDKI